MCVCVFKWRKHLRIYCVEIYERFLTGTQVRVWGPKIAFNMSFLFGRSAFYLRNRGRHSISSRRSVWAAGTLHYCGAHGICLSLPVMSLCFCTWSPQTVASQRLRGQWIWGLHSKDKRQKGLRKITNACRLIFCGQSVYLFIAWVSNFSSMRPINSISSIAKTVLLIKESRVVGPKYTPEGHSPAWLSLSRTPPCQEFQPAICWIHSQDYQGGRDIERDSNGSGGWEVSGVTVKETKDFRWELPLDWASPAPPWATVSFSMKWGT